MIWGPKARRSVELGLILLQWGFVSSLKFYGY